MDLSILMYKSLIQISNMGGMFDEAQRLRTMARNTVVNAEKYEQVGDRDRQLLCLFDGLRSIAAGDPMFDDAAAMIKVAKVALKEVGKPPEPAPA